MKPTRHFKVVGGKDAAGGPPNQEVIDHLEECLEMARAGVMQEILIIGMTDKKVMVNGWSKWPSVFGALGALYQTITDYQRREIVQYRPDYHDGMA